jgi:hypothetical protein
VLEYITCTTILHSYLCICDRLIGSCITPGCFTDIGNPGNASELEIPRMWGTSTHEGAQFRLRDEGANMAVVSLARLFRVAKSKIHRVRCYGCDGCLPRWGRAPGVKTVQTTGVIDNDTTASGNTYLYLCRPTDVRVSGYIAGYFYIIL